MGKVYKVGDKVTVRNDLVVGEDYDKMSFVRQMVGFRGSEVTISSVNDIFDPVRYEIYEDDGDDWWTNDMFVQPKTPSKIKVTLEGTKITVTMGDKVGIAKCNTNVDEYDEKEGIRIAICRLFDIEPFETTVIEKQIQDFSLEELLQELTKRV